MANPEHLEILKQGVDQWNKWRREHPELRLDLTAADLEEADLRDATLKKESLGGNFVGRFWRAPPPSTGRTHRNPNRFQVCAGGFTTDSGRLLDPPQRPSQPPQS